MRNVLFLCTHNSARSILAEALLNHLDSRAPTRRWQAWSAGSSPRPGQQPHPLALEVLQRAGISTEGLHSKNWDEFAAPGAPHMDLIITVCDSAAGEYWGYADPSAGDAPDAAKREAFRQTLHAIKRRLELLLNLPVEKLEQNLLQETVRGLSSH